MTQATTRPPGGADRPRGAVSARVSLGRVFAPVPVEFLLIASTALLLTGFGVVMVLSATTASALSAGESPYNDGLQQGIYAALGVPLMFIVSRFPVAFFRKIAWIALFGAVALQLLVFVPGIGYAAGGNLNWIRIGGLSAQPSEFLKLALALWAGLVLYRKRFRLDKLRHVAIPLVPIGVLAIGTVLAGHDLGTVIILVLVLLGTLFFSGVRLRIFLLPVVLGAIAVIGYAVTSENRMNRILSMFDSECDYLKECYQPLHGIWGLASGGVFGMGLGNSTEKYNWLPAAGDDYIFAIVGEELGLIGCVVVLLLFATFAVGAFRIIRNSEDPFVKMVSGGIVAWIIGQALINIGVVLRVIPVLGVPLPFMSAGGSSLIAVLLASGVLLAFCRTIPVGAEPSPPRPVR
ncbi:putative lipid II flippase FtsW [Microbacterium album]|uniref:Probable peptidoglycan glycosyltransferase FtsW n=1 Tax=Microbacterium album TaxID=2053191 RepID=A0A917IE60_9MICO|nr:putative lipid II flippase FtsW [Microbacterium album]GGH40393.1 cell division protein FtsW [Microbacterium album]